MLTTFRVVIILVEFPDKKFEAGTSERFKDLFFSTGKISTGSATEYYQEVSNGLVSLTGDIFGPFQLDNPITYYAQGQYGESDLPPNSCTMANDVVTAIGESIDLGPYDNDGDQYVGF